MDFIKSQKTTGNKCVFCELPAKNADEETLILFRAQSAFVIMNKYPYNNGHLMAIPFRHTANFDELSKEELEDLMRLTQYCTQVLGRVYSPDGFNIGMNLGAAGGAGIKEQLHFHIVPRWQGDTNFMPVLAEAKSLPQHLESSYQQIVPYFRSLHEKS
jgi:ATP adenylyltransferase